MILKKRSSRRWMTRVIVMAVAICMIASPLSMSQKTVQADGSDYNTDDEEQIQAIESFVTRLYDVCLDRQPDYAGLHDWSSKLIDKQATGVSVAYGFVFSNEFQSKGYSNEEYIKLMYSAFFGRPADQGGLDYWLAKMNSGMNREELFAGFANSDEFYALCSQYGIVRGDYFVGKDVNQTAQVNLFVERLYNVILGRSCDKAGMTDWTTKLVNKTLSGTEVAYGFVFSPEFIGKNLSNDLFVEQLYRAFMGRASDPSGKADWVGQLDSNCSRESVFNGFALSQEFEVICRNYGINRGEAIAVTGPGTRGPSSTGGDGKLTVLSWNEEFSTLIDLYYGNNYEKKQVPSNEYQIYLDVALASGENAPDLFLCDIDYASKYINSDYTIAVNDLGISDSELSQMFNYTLQCGRDNSGVLKGLTWNINVSGVFYNRSLASQYLGVSKPEDVQKYFATWDSFLSTARNVNSASGGKVKVISGTDDIFRAFEGSCTTNWTVNGEANVDPVMLDYMDLAKTLYDEDLTFDTAQWTNEWLDGGKSNTILSYWGPMWLGKYSLELSNWGLVKAPTASFWGGSWMMASIYCDAKTSVADIMRALTINETNLRAMARNGEYVNSAAIMSEMANDSNYSVSWLGGQNPCGILASIAEDINYRSSSENDGIARMFFVDAVSSYIHGEISSRSNAINYYNSHYDSFTN